jgi:hypothetical protein
MAAEKAKITSKAHKPEGTEVTFKCRLCEKEKPIAEMKVVVRFRPPMVVCEECEKTLR